MAKDREGQHLSENNEFWHKYESPKDAPPRPGYYLVYYPETLRLKIHIARFDLGGNQWDPLDHEHVGPLTHWRDLPKEPDLR